MTSPSHIAERALSYALPPGTLAAFATGLDWGAIQALDRNHGPAWWRQAVAESEGRGLLEWDRLGRVWILTSEGRVAVRGVS